MSVYRRLGGRYWHGIPIKLGAAVVDRHFECRFYGVGFWMCPIVPGLIFWRRRSRPQGTGETGASDA